VAEPLLTVGRLSKAFAVRRSWLDRLRPGPIVRAVAVDDVSIAVTRGETVGIVGESGSGKTTLARCLLRLIEPDSGSVSFDGNDVIGASRTELQRIRRRIQMVFQDPYSSLNPRIGIGETIAEPARVHQVIERSESRRHAQAMLQLVGLPGAFAERYPRQLSGGQRQRVAIARALSVQPEFLIADEPVSALDVSIQAQILNLLVDLVAKLGLTTIFIAHQLSVVRHISDRVAIMYLGRIVELAPTATLFARPQHPYTVGLLEAAPRPDPNRRHRKPALIGDIPSPLNVPSGCRFRTRCRYAEARCSSEDPLLREVAPSHYVACHVLPFKEVPS